MKLQPARFLGVWFKGPEYIMVQIIKEHTNKAKVQFLSKGVVFNYKVIYPPINLVQRLSNLNLGELG